MNGKKEKPLFILHEYGAPGHYEGLQYYCNEHGIKTCYYEFTWLRQLLSGIKHGNGKKIVRAIRNGCFLIRLACSRDAMIILGAAPFDFRMLFLSILARRHNIFYHTSWIVWDGSLFPKKRFYRLFKNTISGSWKNFLEQGAKGIFCVSARAAAEISSNFTIACPVSVVYHAIDESIFFPGQQRSMSHPLGLLFAGRLLKEKGIPEILRLVADLPAGKFVIGIAGEGNLSAAVKEVTRNNSSVIYHNKLSKAGLGDLYRKYDILLFPSRKRPGGFEELFGISLIEGMACGMIPLAADHAGPSEIIRHHVNGYLLREEHVYEDMLHYVNYLLHADESQVNTMKKEAAERGARFCRSRIADGWAVILNPYFTGEETASRR